MATAKGRPYRLGLGFWLATAVALETPPVQFQQVVAIRRADQGKPPATR